MRKEIIKDHPVRLTLKMPWSMAGYYPGQSFHFRQTCLLKEIPVPTQEPSPFALAPQMLHA